MHYSVRLPGALFAFAGSNGIILFWINGKVALRVEIRLYCGQEKALNTILRSPVLRCSPRDISLNEESIVTAVTL